MKSEPLVFERTYNAPAAKVWQAITSKEQMKQWYFDIKEFKAEPGFEFQFLAGPEHRQYLHLCKVKEVVPGRKLSYTWRYDGYTGESLVTFELFEEGDKTRLKLTHEGVESFPGQEHPEFSKESFSQGWTYILGTSLEGYLK